MNLKGLSLRAIVVGACLSLPVFLMHHTLKKDLAQVTAVAAARLGQSVAPLLQKAHQAGDDLALQEVIQAMARAQGIFYACVVNKENKAIVHSRLSEIGKPIAHRLSPTMWSYSLMENGELWGKLIYRISDDSERALGFHQWIGGLASALILWILGFSWIWNSQKHLFTLQESLNERDALLEEEKANCKALEEDFRGAKKSWTSWAQSAIEYAPCGLILLDHRQRIAAANKKSAQLLGFVHPSDLMGRSWLEIPCLQGFGPTLEKSLAAPDQNVEAMINLGLTLYFRTNADLSGTWLQFDSLRLSRKG